MNDSDPNDGRVRPLRLVVTINVSLAGDAHEALLRFVSTAAHSPATEPSGLPLTGAEDQWLTLNEAAEFVGISTSTLYKYASQGKIESRKLAGRLQFRRSVLDGFMDKHVRPARHGPQLRSIISTALGSGR